MLKCRCQNYRTHKSWVEWNVFKNTKKKNRVTNNIRWRALEIPWKMLYGSIQWNNNGFTYYFRIIVQELELKANISFLFLPAIVQTKKLFSRTETFKQFQWFRMFTNVFVHWIFEFIYYLVTWSQFADFRRSSEHNENQQKRKKKINVEGISSMQRQTNIFFLILNRKPYLAKIFNEKKNGWQKREYNQRKLEHCNKMAA